MRHWNWPEPLFSLLRGNFNEITLFGEIVLVDHQGVVFTAGQSIGEYAARSLLKPYQLAATGKPAAEWLTESPNRTMVAMGSISGTREQIEQIGRWYRPEEVAQKDPFLVFERAYPPDEGHRFLLKEAGEAPRACHHPCFSKHMMILEGCERQGFSLQNYHHREHPYQQALSDWISRHSGRSAARIEWVTDGCLLPTPVLSLAEMARLYQQVAGAKEGPLQAAAQMMGRFPQWIGGPGRIDTQLVELNAGKIFAKEGADGLLGLGILPNRRFPQGAGLIVKLASGYQPELAGMALTPLLEALHLTPYTRKSRGHEVHYHYRPFDSERRKVVDVSPTLSEQTAVWPGDVPFRREIGCATDAGSHLTLSVVTTTLHVGTHTDAHNHFLPQETGIAHADVRSYIGPCQVVTAKPTACRGVLVPADLGEVEIRAVRVLFRTGSAPDPNHFNQDFVALSPELVKWLAARKVVMVGIDTPSIDPFASKEMAAHRATREHGLRILEGLVLDGAEDGLYDLTAVPLKIEKADASPVRAVLRRME